MRRRIRSKKESEEYDHDNFTNFHLSDDKKTTHPLSTIMSKEYKRLKPNIIILSKPIIVDDNSLNRKIYYIISEVGKNIITQGSPNNIIIKLRETKQQFFIIAIEKKNLVNTSNVTLFSRDNDKKTHKYRRLDEKHVILMICGSIPPTKIDNTKDSITIEDLKTISKIIPNQILQ